MDHNLVMQKDFFSVDHNLAREHSPLDHWMAGLQKENMLLFVCSEAATCPSGQAPFVLVMHRVNKNFLFFACYYRYLSDSVG